MTRVGPQPALNRLGWCLRVRSFRLWHLRIRRRRVGRPVVWRARLAEARISSRRMSLINGDRSAISSAIGCPKRFAVHGLIRGCVGRWRLPV
jgi:hypothetical protein